MARNVGFETHDKKDSTGICFIGERRFRDFLEHYLPASPGNVKTPTGEVIGCHQGLMYYTIGQRQGLGIGGVAGHDESPWFVAAKVLEKNELIAVQGRDHPLLFNRGLVAGPAHWISEKPPPHPFRCHARCRHRQPLQACTLQYDGSMLKVTFDQPQRAITPGQSVVFYDGKICLGGAVIEGATDAWHQETNR
jgi:tRNA-specific 2-thiouridylase